MRNVMIIGRGSVVFVSVPKQHLWDFLKSFGEAFAVNMTGDTTSDEKAIRTVWSYRVSEHRSGFIDVTVQLLPEEVQSFEAFVRNFSGAFMPSSKVRRKIRNMTFSKYFLGLKKKKMKSLLAIPIRTICEQELKEIYWDHKKLPQQVVTFKKIGDVPMRIIATLPPSFLLGCRGFGQKSWRTLSGHSREIGLPWQQK